MSEATQTMRSSISYSLDALEMINFNNGFEAATNALDGRSSVLMTRFISNLLVLGIAATLILMAVESESILQWFGYSFGALLFIAVTVNWSRASKN